MNRYEAEQALTEKENNAVVYNTKFAFAVEQISEHSSLRKRICDYVFEHIYYDVDEKIKKGAHKGNYGLCVFPLCGYGDPMNDSLENMYRTLVSLAPSYLKGMVREHNRCDMQFITETVAQHYRNEGYSVSTPYTDKYGRVHAHAEDRYSDGSIMYTVTLRWGGKTRRNTPPSYISTKEIPACENKAVETAAGQIAECVASHPCELFAGMKDRLREIIEKNMDRIWDNASEEEHSAFNMKSGYLQKNYNRNPARRIAWYTGTNGGIITAVALLGTMFMPAGVWFIPCIVSGAIVLNLASAAYDLPCRLWEGHFLRRIRKKDISLAGNTLYEKP